MPDEVVFRAGLAAGIVLDRPLLRRLRRELRAAEALTLAARALARANLSRDRLDARLAGAGLTPAEREQALATLQSCGYVDDDRLAEARAGALAERGWGDAAIAARLEAEGIGAELVRAALAALAPEAERASALVRRGQNSRNRASFLARRGFDETAIESALGALDADGRAGLR